jgi:hypothetical protein
MKSLLFIGMLPLLYLCKKPKLDPLSVESDIRSSEGDPPDPYLGGLHSTDAHFISVFFSRDPGVYAPRTFPETLRNIQDLLVTGGVNTNVFRSPREKLGRLYERGETEETTWVVNTREEAEAVVRFMRDQDPKMVRAIRTG